jgi:hypothetical protein
MIIYTTMLSVVQAIYRPLIGRSVNNKLERLHNEADVACFESLFRYLCGWTEENHE